MDTCGRRRVSNAIACAQAQHRCNKHYTVHHPQQGSKRAPLRATYPTSTTRGHHTQHGGKRRTPLHAIVVRQHCTRVPRMRTVSLVASMSRSCFSDDELTSASRALDDCSSSNDRCAAARSCPRPRHSSTGSHRQRPTSRQRTRGAVRGVHVPRRASSAPPSNS